MNIISNTLDFTAFVLYYFLICILIILIVITFPIWIVPYLIFRHCSR